MYILIALSLCHCRNESCHNHNRTEQNIFARFRCCNFKLAIETGRHLNVDFDKRYCPYCKSNGISVVEDEWHIFYMCDAYLSLRNKYISKYFSKCPTPENFKSIIQSNDA